MTTVDLLGELRAVEKMARAAQQRIRDGKATTGAAMLRKIEERAHDAVRHGSKRERARAAR
jgi:hypothetical protein